MTESRIQQEIVQWYTNTFCLKHHQNRCLIMHVPNEGQQRLVAIGLLPGASDLIVIHFGIVLFVEVKTETGIQSSKQKEFEQRVILLGLKYFLVRSLADFKNIINFTEH